jgi:mycothiol synthase
VDGQPPFSDQSLIELRRGERRLILVDGAAAILAAGEAEFVVDPDARGRGIGTAMLERIVAETDGELRIWAHGDHPAARALAASHALAPERELLQLRATVPVDQTRVEGVDTFRPGVDDAAWLALNAKAFAHHPEQGGVRQADLDGLMAEPWFAADDFLVLRDGAELIGYCWLKVEDDLGEFYVVGVDPARQGEGHGRRLMNAGFARLASRGIRTAHLYVEADNAQAIGLYASFGFARHTIDIQYALHRN